MKNVSQTTSNIKVGNYDLKKVMEKQPHFEIRLQTK